MLSTTLDFPRDMIQFSVLALEDLGFSQELLSRWSQSFLWNWVYKCTFEYYRKHEGNIILFKFIILPSCERALKNGRVKSKIVRKSSFDDMMFFLTSDDCIWSLFIFFCIMPKKVLLLKYRKWVSHLKNRCHYAKMVENARKNFKSVFIAPCCFLEKKTSNFWK